MEIWIKNDDYKLRLPVLPSSYTIGSESNNTSVNINAIGEVNLIGNRTLDTVTFSALFPAKYNATYCDIKPEYAPKEYRTILTKMQRAGKVHLQITGTKFNKDCTIESLSSHEDDGTGDLTIDFSFKEYRLPKVTKKKATTKKQKSKKKTKTTASRTSKSTKNKTYTVKKGDCLSAITKSQTGKSSNWKAIYADNKSVIGSNPNKIKPGQKLKIRASY